MPSQQPQGVGTLQGREIQAGEHVVSMLELATIGHEINHKAKAEANYRRKEDKPRPEVGYHGSISDLWPGDRFQLAGEVGIEGVLVRISPGLGSALVRIDKGKEPVFFVDKSGARHEFEGKRASTVTWSAGTRVIKLEDGDEDGATSESVPAWNGEIDMNGVSLKPSKQEKDGKSKSAKPVAKAKDAKAKGPKVKKEATNDCGDGCGQKVVNRFKPGHDSRFYSMCKKLVAGEVKFSDLPQITRSIIKNTAGAQAALDAHAKPAAKGKGH